MPPIGKNGRFIKKKEAERKDTASESMKLILIAKSKKKEEEKKPVYEIGKRVLDIGVLAKSMWCELCDIPLSWRFLEKEKQYGIASVFQVRCCKCLCLKTFNSSKKVKEQDGAGYPLYSINCKVSAGCVDSGIGHEQVNTLFSAMDLPSMNHNILKRGEKRVGRAFEELAKQSCKEALMEERALTVKESQTNVAIANALKTTDSGEQELIFEYDFGWDKRGSGFSYDSKSGRGSAIGYFSKRICAYGVMSSACARCARGEDPSTHDCRKNHEGSSKAMEPQCAVNILVNNPDFKEAKVKTGILVADEDASTFARVKAASNQDVRKWIDRNHVTKKYNNKLYSASKTHKFVSTKVIKYLKRCFCYAIGQNQFDVPGLIEALRNIVKHTFGEHEACGEWCRAKDNPEYRFSRLPGGNPFSCPRWRADFTDILELYVAKAEMIAPCGSSQRNESFNSMCVTVAPKSRFLASSSALNIRVAAAVLQKNRGATHITDVMKVAGLSPGQVTSKLRQMKERRRAKERARKQSQEFRRRRLFLKDQKSGDNSRGEGLSYVSGMANTMERAVANTLELSGAFIPEPCPLEDSAKVVVIDTETTGFGGQAELVQVAAKCGDKEFSAYMRPKKPIHPKATEVTGFSVVNKMLLYHGDPVRTSPSETVARDFLAFLSDLDSQVVLTGHNIKAFDMPVILRWLSSHGVAKDLLAMTYGITDTLPILRQGKVRKLDALAELYLQGPSWAQLRQGAHNAATDNLLLVGLLQHFNISDADLKEAALPTHQFMGAQAMAKRQKDNLPSLAPLERCVSKQMLNKMARAGITVEELQNEFKAHGQKGIAVSLGVQVDGKPRVTTNKKIVQSVVKFVEESLVSMKTV